METCLVNYCIFIDGRDELGALNKNFKIQEENLCFEIESKFEFYRNKSATSESRHERSLSFDFV